MTGRPPPGARDLPTYSNASVTNFFLEPAKFADMNGLADPGRFDARPITSTRAKRLTSPLRELSHGEKPERRAEDGGRGRCEDPGPSVRGPAGDLAALLPPHQGPRRRPVRGRDRLRRVEHPGLPADPGERHAPDRRPGDRVHGPDPRGPDPEHDLQRVRPRDARGLYPRPAPHRPEGGSLLEGHRARRHQLLGSRGGILHLRRRPLRPECPVRLLLHRLVGRRLEHGPPGGPEPGLQAPAQGGVFPGPAGRPVPGPPFEDDPEARGGGDPHRGPPPRGRHRRAGRDRHEVRDADEDGRQPDVLQVHHQERRPAARQVRDLHAQADLRR